VNHTSFPKEDHLPDWARRNNKVTKGDRAKKVEGFFVKMVQTKIKTLDFSPLFLFSNLTNISVPFNTLLLQL